MTKTLFFDIETHGAEHLYTMPPEQFVRLIGYKFAGDEDVTITRDIEEIKTHILAARWIIGHNIHSFDLPALFGIHSDIPLQLSDEGRVYDTWTHAALVNPAPADYVNRHGVRRAGGKDNPVGHAKAWNGLDEQAFQLGVIGKTDDLKALAKEFGGYGDIPVDDERYIKYLKGDVLATERLAKELLRLGGLDDYAMREQRIEARKAAISANGLRVDQAVATARVEGLRVRREKILNKLEETYGFPTEGKSPWATIAGKEAILSAFKAAGVTPESRPDWPRSARTGDLSLGGKILIDVTKGTEAEELGQALAELKGQRSLAQLALDSTHSDGFVHPQITMLQRSGRWSTTDPGLTIWTARGEGSVEKSYFLPDNDDEVLLEIDYSNADARIVAALSGDKKYAERFEPGADGHMINAIAAWGQAVVDTDPAGYRQKAKPLGHGWSYGGGFKKLSAQAGVPLQDAKTFCEGMKKAYPTLVAWQNEARREGRSTGAVVNAWGRRMPVEPGREYTQAPALQGQSGTREIVCDALLRMPYEVLRCCKGNIHDALLFSVPRASWERARNYLVKLMSTTFKGLEFPVEAGPPGSNWYEAGH